MIYYLVKVQTPDQAVQSLVFALNSNQSLMDQVVAKLGNQVHILDIHVLNWEWNQVLKELPCDDSPQGSNFS